MLSIAGSARCSREEPQVTQKYVADHFTDLPSWKSCTSPTGQGPPSVAGSVASSTIYMPEGSAEWQSITPPPR